MGLETTVNIADLVKTNPASSDPKSQGDDHLRNIKTALLNDFAGFAGAVIVTGVDGGAADAYTLTPANALVAYTSKMLIEFTPAATNLTTTPTLNISSLGAKTIKSVSNGALLAGDIVLGTPTLAIYDGTSVRLIGPTKNYIDQLAFSAALPTQSLGFLRSDGAVAAFTQTHTGYAQNEVKGADIASAGTINLTTATGNLVHITGTTTITAITIPVGAERTVIFDGILTLTHGAALLLPGAANITTAANDRAIVRGDTAGAVVTSYTRADGRPLITSAYELLGTSVFTTPAANIDFLTTFTSVYDKYVIEIRAVAATSTDNLAIRLAKTGVVDSTAVYYTPVSPGSALSSGATQATLASNVNTVFPLVMTVEVRNTNDATNNLKGIGLRGLYQTAAPSTLSTVMEGAYASANAMTGFRLFFTGGANFASAAVRVYGVRNT